MWRWRHRTTTTRAGSGRTGRSPKSSSTRPTLMARSSSAREGCSRISPSRSSKRVSRWRWTSISAIRNKESSGSMSWPVVGAVSGSPDESSPGSDEHAVTDSTSIEERDKLHEPGTGHVPDPRGKHLVPFTVITYRVGRDGEAHPPSFTVERKVQRCVHVGPNARSGKGVRRAPNSSGWPWTRAPDTRGAWVRQSPQRSTVADRDGL